MVKVVFLHPDLGIGGAERLVVDAALALKSKGHEVEFVTTHHDINHCFMETKDGTFSVTVVGDWLPRKVFGFFYALCAYIRMLYAALYIVFFSNLKPDIVFCDLISICIPIINFSGTKTLFYCHFPDQLLSHSGGVLKSMYRAPLNWLEEKTTGQANAILVNSKFTATVFKNTFKNLQIKPDILYPTVNTDAFEKFTSLTVDQVIGREITENHMIFLSINRYERKKNLKLALDAMNQLKLRLTNTDWANIYLIMVGGYDKRVIENVEHYEELINHSNKLGLADKVVFLRSPSDIEKFSLLNHCHCLVYTPSNEHFGIVPLEAMYVRKPVIAANSGGPTETVVDGITGFSCNPQPEDFAEAMSKLISDENLRKKLGNSGHERMIELFCFKAFSNQLDKIIKSLVNIKEKVN